MINIERHVGQGDYHHLNDDRTSRSPSLE